MFGNHTHNEVRKAFLNIGINITTRRIAKFRRNEPSATAKVMEALAEKNKGLGSVQPEYSKKKDKE